MFGGSTILTDNLLINLLKCIALQLTT